jgi:hypothetical protein
MPRIPAFLALLLVLAGVPAGAVAGPVDDARADLVRADETVERLAGRRAELAAELEAVAGAIEARKARARGVLGDEALAELLRRSQSLAERITGLDREQTAAAERRTAAALAVLAAHDVDVAAARQALVAASAERRAAALESLRRRQADRETARRELLARLGGPERAPASIAVAPTDDPDELREQADLFRDDRDRVRKELAAVEQRLAERAEQARLERELGDFLGDRELLGDEDRVVSVRRQETSSSSQQSIGEPPPPGATTVVGGTLAPLPGQAGSSALPADDGSTAALEARKAALARLAADLDTKARALDEKARAPRSR